MGLFPKKKKKKNGYLMGLACFQIFLMLVEERHYGLDIYWVFIFNLFLIFYIMN